jgi:hypothetical protein
MLNPHKFLSDNYTKLPAKDHAFAQSLLASQTLSEKQHAWIVRLADRAAGVVVEAPAVQVGNFAGVIALFETAKAHLKFPKIRLQLNDGRKVVLTLAGQNAKAPGTVNVTDGGKFPANVWYGRVTPAGEWQVSGKIDAATQRDVAGLLAVLANDPAGTAAAYGTMTGSCCFCALTLTDARSIEVGYGPICASHYQLPWGLKCESV